MGKSPVRIWKHRKQNYVEYAGRPKAYVIEILTEQVSDAYLTFLREKEISYIFAGTDVKIPVWH